MWHHAGLVYTEFAARDPSPKRRRDIYLCVLACMNAPADHVWRVYRPAALSRTEVKRVMSRFYCNSAKS